MMAACFLGTTSAVATVGSKSGNRLNFFEGKGASADDRSLRGNGSRLWGASSPKAGFFATGLAREASVRRRVGAFGWKWRRKRLKCLDSRLGVAFFASARLWSS